MRLVGLGHEHLHCRFQKQRRPLAPQHTLLLARDKSAMNFILPTTIPTASASLLPIRRHPAAGLSLPSPRKPNRFRIPPKPPRFSRVPSISPSLKTPTVSDLFLLAAGLLSLSGNRPLPALASTPPPTLQPQEIEGQHEDEQQESEERKKEVEKAEEKEKVGQNEDEDDDEMRMYSAILSHDPGDVDALKCALYAKMRRAD